MRQGSKLLRRRQAGHIGHSRLAWRQGFPFGRPGEPFYAGTRLRRASAMRLRAQRREVLPNMPASLRSDSGLPVWRLARYAATAAAMVSLSSGPVPAARNQPETWSASWSAWSGAVPGLVRPPGPLPARGSRDLRTIPRKQAQGRPVPHVFRVASGSSASLASVGRMVRLRAGCGPLLVRGPVRLLLRYG